MRTSDKFTYDTVGNLILSKTNYKEHYYSYVAHNSNRAVSSYSDLEPNYPKQAVYDVRGNQKRSVVYDNCTYDFQNNIQASFCTSQEIGKTEFSVFSKPSSRSKKIIEHYDTHGNCVFLSVFVYLGEVISYESYIGVNLKYNGDSVKDAGKIVSAECRYRSLQILVNDRIVGRLLHNSSYGNLNSKSDYYSCYLTDVVGSIGLSVCALAEGQTYKTYSSYGTTTSRIGGNLNDLYGFNGKEVDADKSIYFGYRNYFPETKRWNAPDPLGVLSGINGYVFVEDNPFSLKDFMGLFPYGKEHFGKIQLLIAGLQRTFGLNTSSNVNFPLDLAKIIEGYGGFYFLRGVSFHEKTGTLLKIADELTQITRDFFNNDYGNKIEDINKNDGFDLYSRLLEVRNTPEGLSNEEEWLEMFSRIQNFRGAACFEVSFLAEAVFYLDKRFEKHRSKYDVFITNWKEDHATAMVVSKQSYNSFFLNRTDNEIFVNLLSPSVEDKKILGNKKRLIAVADGWVKGYKETVLLQNFSIDYSSVCQILPFGYVNLKGGIMFPDTRKLVTNKKTIQYYFPISKHQNDFHTDVMENYLGVRKWGCKKIDMRIQFTKNHFSNKKRIENHLGYFNKEFKTKHMFEKANFVFRA